MCEVDGPPTFLVGPPTFSSVRHAVQEYESIQLLLKSNEVRLRDALRKLLATQLSAAQDKVDDSSAHVQNSVAFQDEANQDGALQDEAMQDTAQSDDAGRDSG